MRDLNTLEEAVLLLDEWIAHAQEQEAAWIRSHRAMQVRIDELERELNEKSVELFDRVSEEVAASLAADEAGLPF